MLSREKPDEVPEKCLTPDEISILRRIALHKKPGWKGVSLRDYHFELAKIGGFLARKSDGDPGFITTWRGYLKLQDMIYGYKLA